MKTIKYFQAGSLLPLLLLLVCCTQAIAQSSAVPVTATVRNGRLVFPTRAAFEQTYQLLAAEADAYQEPEGTPEKEEGQSFDYDPTLASWESRYPGFTSLRKLAQEDEFAQLRAGRTPEALVERSWVPDRAAEAMLDGNYTVQVADTIYYLLDKNTLVKVLYADENVLRAVLAGAPLAPLEGRIIVEYRGDPNADGNCQAAFTASASYTSSLSGFFTFTGSGVNATTTYHWNFGDNTTSNQKNPTKTFAQPGEYNVCLTIETKINDTTKCTSQVCKVIKVNRDCFADFKFEKSGVAGQICFTSLSAAAGGGAITSYSWNFGDGTPVSTEANPCHTFICDKPFNVTLSITTASGCRAEVTITVTISSYACCDKDIDENETKFEMEVEAGKRKIKGNCEDFYFLFGLWSNVNAELRHFKKGVAGIWWPKKSNIKAEIDGNVYTKDQNDCVCKNPYNVDCEESGNKMKVKAKKHIPAKFKTWKEDRWVAKFYEGGVLRKTVVAPIDCN